MSTAPSASHLLIVGAGSVGRRHLRNFAALGARVSAVDPRSERLAEARGEVRLEGEFSALPEAIAAASFAGVVICSPPSAHVEQALECLAKDLPLLIEKPLGISASDARRLAMRERRVPVLLGYTYRWWPPLADFIAAIRDGKVGPPRHVRCVLSAHLADWHPWERYQDFFMARAALGGGALLDESHMLDLMLWYFGLPQSVYARVDRLSDLQIDTDDNVDALLEYPDGLRVVMHLDLYGRPHERRIQVVGDAGTIEWTFDPNEIRLGLAAERSWQTTRYEFERNDMFVNVAREFLELVGGTRRAPTCTVEDGIRVLEVIDCMRTSSARGIRIAVESRV